MTETKLITTNLNHTVLKRKSDIRHLHYDIVLLEIDGGKEYTTHIHNLENGGIGNGHYFIDLGDAEKDFRDRH
jgi:hypothetical protein